MELEYQTSASWKNSVYTSCVVLRLSELVRYKGYFESPASDFTEKSHLGFPGGASGKEPACQCRRHKKCRFDLRSLGQEDPLEESMVTHSNILVWRILWTEEPGRLQSVVLEGVRHDWNDLAHSTHTAFTCCVVLGEKNHFFL